MPPLYEVLYLFSSAQGHLVEIKRLDQPAAAPKDLVYQWLWLQRRTVHKLHFVAMGTSLDDQGPRQLRSFAEGALWFNEQAGEMRFSSGRTIALTPDPLKSLSKSLARMIALHLS